MDPISIGLGAIGALSKLGGIFGGSKKKKTIDPAVLQRLFGAGAVNKEMMDLFNQAINSVHGQQLMTNAAEQGQQFERDTNRAAAAAGLGPAGGASGGADIFASSAAQGATNSLQRQVQSGLMEQMLPIAQQIVQDRMGAYMQSYMNAQNQPYVDTPLGAGLSAVGDLAGQFAQDRQQHLAQQKAGAQTDTTGQQPTLQQMQAPVAVTAPVSPLQQAQTTALWGAPSFARRPSRFGMQRSRLGFGLSRFGNMMGSVQPAMAGGGQ